MQARLATQAGWSVGHFIKGMGSIWLRYGTKVIISIILYLIAILILYCLWGYIGIEKIYTEKPLINLGRMFVILIILILMVSLGTSIIRGYNLEGFKKNIKSAILYIFLLNITGFLVEYISNVWIFKKLGGLGFIFILIFVLFLILGLYRVKRSKGLGTGDKYPLGYKVLFRDFRSEVSYLNNLVLLIYMGDGIGLDNPKIGGGYLVLVTLLVYLNLLDIMIMLLNKGYRLKGASIKERLGYMVKGELGLNLVQLITGFMLLILIVSIIFNNSEVQLGIESYMGKIRNIRLGLSFLYVLSFRSRVYNLGVQGGVGIVGEGGEELATRVLSSTKEVRENLWKRIEGGVKKVLGSNNLCLIIGLLKILGMIYHIYMVNHQGSLLNKGLFMILGVGCIVMFRAYLLDYKLSRALKQMGLFGILFGFFYITMVVLDKEVVRVTLHEKLGFWTIIISIWVFIWISLIIEDNEKLSKMRREVDCEIGFLITFMIVYFLIAYYVGLEDINGKGLIYKELLKNGLVFILGILVIRIGGVWKDGGIRNGDNKYKIVRDVILMIFAIYLTIELNLNI